MLSMLSRPQQLALAGILYAILALITKPRHVNTATLPNPVCSAPIGTRKYMGVIAEVAATPLHRSFAEGAAQLGNETHQNEDWAGAGLQMQYQR